MHDIFTVELFCRDIISLECGRKYQCKQREYNDCLIFIRSHYVSQIYGYILISKDNSFNISGN